MVTFRVLVREGKRKMLGLMCVSWVLENEVLVRAARCTVW